MANKGVAALRQFTRCKGKTGGRNSQGRITAFHRGGGPPSPSLCRRLLRSSLAGEAVPGRSCRTAFSRQSTGGLSRDFLRRSEQSGDRFEAATN